VDARAQAIERLYRERYSAFRNLAATVTGAERARDAVQEGFARALAQRGQLRREESLEAWVWRIVLRAALETRREPANAPLADAVELIVPAAEHDPALADALASLPPRRRLVVFLHYVADLSYADVAAVCGVSEGTVAATLAQARRQLSDALALDASARGWPVRPGMERSRRGWRSATSGGSFQ
jgi:RNA polymerase sigma-70 factor (ECF subfamily)